jgi:short subunit dehydrogenase-like uncharacterized protein
MSKKPVIIYGASGYTGRLIAEYLREYGVPFTAAGRSKAAVEAAMASVPGIETAQFDVLEVSHDVDALASAFSGRKVVCNVVGPFITKAATTLEAALKAGIHYIDTTGEQASIRAAQTDWGGKFGDKGLACVPATAYMYAPAEIAARIALETPGTDSVDGITLFDGIPTFTSTQSIYVQLKEEAYYLLNNELVKWPRAQGYEVQMPGQHETKLALPWGGTGNPVWLLEEPSVRNCKWFAGVMSREIMTGVVAMQKDYEETVRPLPPEEQERVLLERAGAVQASMPPRENPLLHRTVDSAMARGSTAASHVALYGTCAYKQTGVIQAAAAQHLINSNPRKAGFASPCSAFGHRELLVHLESSGLTRLQRFY